MEDEEKPEVTPDEGTDYLEALTELKKNSVPREDYEKLISENKRLLQTLIEGGQIQMEPEEAPDIDKLRKELFGQDSDLTNLEYATRALQLRDALIAQEQPDPFLPYGARIQPTKEDVEAAQRVADVFKHCIEYADGDNAAFTTELQRLTIDAKTGRR